jgi:lipopolysaccharide/colanic/teichoic acid biosynthesis glycosyltransferase
MLYRKYLTLYLDLLLVSFVAILLYHLSRRAAALPLIAIVVLYALRGFDDDVVRRRFSLLVRAVAAATLSLVLAATLGGVAGLSPVYRELALAAVGSVGLLYGAHRIAALAFAGLIPVARVEASGVPADLLVVWREIEKATQGNIALHASLPAGEHLSGKDPLHPHALMSHFRRDPLTPLRQKIVVNLPRLSELVLERLPTAILARDPGLQRTVGPPTGGYGTLKRATDILASAILLVFFAPVMALIGLAILIEDGRPVVFRQNRVGLGERTFVIYKFRSLKQAPGAEENPNAAIEKRVLRIGRLIRRTRLDETPQLVNVLLGTMSLIGPRPEMASFHQKGCERIPYYRRRLLVRPGITGWAQLNFPHTSSDEAYHTKTEYDLYYVKNMSLALDLRIALRTFETMLTGRGAR